MARRNPYTQQNEAPPRQTARYMGREVVVTSVDGEKPAELGKLKEMFSEQLPTPERPWLRDVVSLVLVTLGTIAIAISAGLLWGILAVVLAMGIILLAVGIVVGSS